MKMKKLFAAFLAYLFYISIPIGTGWALAGCKVSYGFSEKSSSLPDSIKTVNVRIVENQSQGYVNPQLVPNITDRLKQKVIRQTKLTQVNTDNAHLDIRSVIRDYAVTTSGVSTGSGRTQASVNRLTINVQITITNQLSGEVKEHNISRSFDFPAGQTLNQAEGQIMDELVRNVSDDIFNRIFSDW